MPTEFNLGAATMGLLGGLALFLFGMEQMSGALKGITGSGLRKLLGELTRNRFLAVVTGAFTTAVVQSSSVSAGTCCQIVSCEVQIQSSLCRPASESVSF